MEPVRIFLVSDFRLMLDSIAALLALETGRFKLTGTAVSFEQTVEAIAGVQTDVIQRARQGATAD